MVSTPGILMTGAPECLHNSIVKKIGFQQSCALLDEFVMTYLSI